jgi:hypothetical protein
VCVWEGRGRRGSTPSPTIRIRTSFFPNRFLKTLEMVSPIEAAKGEREQTSTATGKGCERDESRPNRPAKPNLPFPLLPPLSPKLFPTTEKRHGWRTKKGVHSKEGRKQQQQQKNMATQREKGSVPQCRWGGGREGGGKCAKGGRRRTANGSTIQYRCFHALGPSRSHGISPSGSS